MAQLAVDGESRNLVCRNGGIRIVLFMTGVAITQCIVKASRGMAATAFPDVMSAGERKESMAESCSAPRIGVHLMADGTIVAEIPIRVVRVSGSLVIRHVAIHTFHSHGFEPQQGSGWVARVAFGRVMRSAKRKSSLKVDVGNVTNDP